MKKTMVWAHRGASGVAPENTMSAFRAAEAVGADGLELDVRLTADGVPVVLHDATLERTTDGCGALASRTRAQLRGLDAGAWFAPRFAGEPLPDLEQVLRWAAGRLRLNLEVKEYDAGRAVALLVQRYPACRVLVSAFDHALLQTLKKRFAGLVVGFLSADPHWSGQIERAAVCGAESIHPRQDLVQADHVLRCHARGLKVYPWVVDGADRYRELLAMGVDGIFTNYPHRFCPR